MLQTALATDLIPSHIPTRAVCGEVRRLYQAGFEIADHTISHERLPGMERSKLEKEIKGARDKLADCGVPKVRCAHPAAVL